MNNNTNGNSNKIRKATFNTNTVIIAIGVLSLIFIIIYIYKSYKNLSITPTKTGAALGATCPDYWDSIGNGRCQNSKKIGSCSKMDGADVIDFSSEVFTNTNTGNYAKCRWAKGCNVSWGGIDRSC
jgi:hypothetical protein